MEALSGKTAVIVGASGEKNFGSVIARRLAQEGVNVVVAARREAPLKSLAEDINGLAVSCDVTDERDIERVFGAAREAYGAVDVALYSAGVHALAPIAELSADDVRPTLEVSFIGALLFFKHAAAAMDNGGSVITISSLTARIPGPGYSVYSGTRAGIDYAIRVAAVEYAAHKVRFNSIAASLVETDMTSDFFQVYELIQKFVDEVPAGRMGTLDDVAEAALFLADESRSGYINGHVLDLAGGQQMGHLPRF